MGLREDDKFDARRAYVDDMRREACEHDYNPPNLMRARAEREGASFVVTIDALCEACGHEMFFRLVPAGPIPDVSKYDDHTFGVDYDSVDLGEMTATVRFSLLTDTGKGQRHMDEKVVTVPFRQD